MDINDMRQKRAAALTEARSILAAEKVAPEDEKRADALLAEADDFEAKIKRSEKLHEAEKRDNEVRSALEQGGIRPGVSGAEGETRKGRASDEYRAAFLEYARRGAVEARVLGSGVGSAGGFLIPTELEKQIVQQLRNVTVMRGVAKTIQTSNPHDIPVVTSHGTAAWVGESSAYVASDEVFGKVTLSAFKAGTMILVPEELMFDSEIDLEAYIVAEFVERIAHLEDTAFIVGTGTGQPTGFVGSALVGVTGATGNTTTIANADVLFDLYHSLPRYYRRNATWMSSDAIIKQVRKFKATTGDFVWQPGLQAGQPDTLLGRPYLITDDMPAPAANAKTLAVGDFSYYRIADRGNRSMQRLNERYAELGQVGFKAYERVDGKLVKAEAIAVYQHSAT